MRKGLKKRQDENFEEWCGRLACALCTRVYTPDEVKEILQDVSKVSYIDGVNTERKLQRKWRGWE